MTEHLLAGVNLPVLRGAFDHDLAPNERFPNWGTEFSPMLVFRYLALCRWLGFGAIRIWLCENGEGVRTDGSGNAIGLMPELLTAVRVFQQGARLSGHRLYWSLLDANAHHRAGDPLTFGVAADPEKTRRFADVVAAPIAAELDPELTFAFEIFNEPESLTSEVHGDAGLPWPRVVDSIRTLRAAVKAELPGVPITAGTQASFLPGLLADGVAGDASPVDAIDLHVYHRSGGLPARGDLPVDVGGLPLWAGECGTAHDGATGRSDYLVNYFWNARELGYDAAFLWKLEGESNLVRWREYPAPAADGWELLPLGEMVQHLLRVEWR